MMKFWSFQKPVSYREATLFQEALVEARVGGLLEDTFLFLEHTPVVTRGRGLQFTGESRPRAVPLAELPAGVDFAESQRGGDLTFHNPGQLVIYPIVKLDGLGFGPKHDVAGYLRKLESVLIEELSALGLPARSVDAATGVWIGEKKVASIGIAVRKWVTFHGMALNLANSLDGFRLISPCGFSPEVMGRLADFLPSAERGDWERRMAGRISGGAFEIESFADLSSAAVPTCSVNSRELLSNV
jgi:lipoate-protein ligase B